MALPLLTIDTTDQRYVMWISNLLRRYESTNGRRCIESFSQIPWERLFAIFSNQTHAAHVKGQAIATDVVHGLCLGHIFALLADDNTELHLMSYLGQCLGQLQNNS